MVVSIWERGTCMATFHLAPSEVPGLTAALLEGIRASRIARTR